VSQRAIFGFLFAAAGLAGCASTSAPAGPALDANCPVGSEANLRGRVLNEHDDAIVGAAVVLVPPAAFTKTVGTDQTGSFLFSCITPGEEYEIRIEEPGYRPFRRSRVAAKVPVSDLRIQLQAHDLNLGVR
jgi:hypothetical protein